MCLLSRVCAAHNGAAGLRTLTSPHVPAAFLPVIASFSASRMREGRRESIAWKANWKLQSTASRAGSNPFRGHGVMLDVDLAELYSVKPSVVIQAVRRNRKRYPDDFMFQLTNQELANLKSQSVISSFRFTRCRCHGHSGIDSPNSGGTGQRPLPADRFHGGPGAWGLTPCHAAASPSQRILPDREVSK